MSIDRDTRADLPRYCCAILETADGRLLLERRPPTAARAAGRITCFGGTREPGESPDACIRRELCEELGWCPEHLEHALVLRRAGRVLAWFYRAEAPPDGTIIRTEPGYEALWAPRAGLAAIDLSPWHRAALEAYAAGLRLADV